MKRSIVHRRKLRLLPTKDKSQASKKDIWDKLSIVTIPLVTIVAGAFGTYLTWSSNEARQLQQASDSARQFDQQKWDSSAQREQADRQYQAEMEQRKFEHRSKLEEQRLETEGQLALQTRQARDQFSLNTRKNESDRLQGESTALQQLYEYISSVDPQRREFGYQMYVALGKERLALKLIAVKNDTAGIKVAQVLVQSEDLSVSAAARSVLGGLQNRGACQNFAAQEFQVQARSDFSVEDIRESAANLGIEPEVLAAVILTETGAASALADGRPRILFERHVFHRLTGGRFASDRPNISSPQPGGYLGGSREYDRLKVAAGLDCEAALQATKWGQFHIMGSSYKLAGYSYVDAFVQDVINSGPKELDAFVKYIINTGLSDELAGKDWAAFTRSYNGPSYQTSQYSIRMAEKYEKIKRNGLTADTFR